MSTRIDRYRERLEDERAITLDGVLRVELQRGLFRSTVSLRVFGRRVAHRRLHDHEAEMIYGDVVKMLSEKRPRLQEAVDLICIG
jgi:hypothetical protein